VSAWIAIQEYPFNLAAIMDQMNAKGLPPRRERQGSGGVQAGQCNAVQSAITDRVPLYDWVHVAAVAKTGVEAVIYLTGSLSRPLPTPLS